MRLLAVDTTSSTTLTSGNGYWRKDDDDLLKESLTTSIAGERRILAVHHAPFESEEQDVAIEDGVT